MGRSRGRRKQHSSEDVSGQLFLSFGLLESLFPVEGSELEDAVAGPAGQQAEQVADVAERLDAVEAGTWQERYAASVGDPAVVAADEEPIASAENLPAQIELTDVVVDGQAAIVEKAPKR